MKKIIVIALAFFLFHSQFVFSLDNNKLYRKSENTLLSYETTDSTEIYLNKISDFFRYNLINAIRYQNQINITITEDYPLKFTFITPDTSKESHFNTNLDNLTIDGNISFKPRGEIKIVTSGNITDMKEGGKLETSGTKYNLDGEFNCGFIGSVNKMQITFIDGGITFKNNFYNGDFWEGSKCNFNNVLLIYSNRKWIILVK